MNWETAVIMGLAAYSALVTTGCYAMLRRVFRPATLVPSGTMPPEAATDWVSPIHSMGVFQASRGKPQEPKDNGSVILLTAERDARLLQEDDE